MSAFPPGNGGGSIGTEGLSLAARRIPKGVVPPWPARRSRYQKPGHAGDGGPQPPTQCCHLPIFTVSALETF